MTKRRVAAIGFGLVSGAALLAGVMALPFAASTDDVLANGYRRAFADADTTWTPGPAANIWLSRHREQSAAPRKPVVLGDRITVGRTTRSDVYEVIGLEHIDGEALGLQTMRIQVVTARVDGLPQPQTVRFLFAVEAAPPTPSPPPTDKVL